MIFGVSDRYHASLLVSLEADGDEDDGKSKSSAEAFAGLKGVALRGYAAAVAVLNDDDSRRLCNADTREAALLRLVAAALMHVQTPRWHIMMGNCLT